MKTSRTIEVVLFADIQGYTALMQESEQQAVSMAETFRSTIEGSVDNWRGSVVDFYGDGVLITFPNAEDAVRATIHWQKKFLKSDIPVRMGLHSGTVVRREVRIFGDAVNLASRVESAAVPGSVLVSQAIAADLRNVDDIETSSLGTFSFKNVRDPMEVFAISDPDLVVPSRSDLSTAKMMRSTSRRGTLITMFLIGAIAIAGLLFVYRSSEISRGTDQPERLAILRFDNQTGSEDFAALGPMIADWTTKSLIEEGERNIISAENLGWSDLPQRDLFAAANKAKVSVLMLGRYYLEGGEIGVHAEIINLESQETEKHFSVAGPKNDLISLVNRFLDEMMGYWMVKDRASLALSPPTYRAYQNYLKAQGFLVANPKQAIQLLNDSYRADTSFFEPLFSLYQLYAKEGMIDSLSPLFQVLSDRSADFTTAQELQYRRLVARRSRNFLEAAQFSEKLYGLDSSNYEAMDLAVNYFVSLNFAKHALAIDRSFDEVFFPDNHAITWHPVARAFAHFQLRQYEQVHRIALGYSELRMPDALGTMHLQSLIRLDSFDLCKQFYQTYKIKGLFNTSGRETPYDITAIMLCEMLAICGHEEHFPYYFGELRKLVELHPEKQNKIEGYIAYFEQRYADAADWWAHETLKQDEWPPWLWPIIELDIRSRLGFVQVLLGEDAQEIAGSLQTGGLSHMGLEEYHQARIMVADDNPKEALRLLQTALDKGLHFFGPSLYGQDVFLLALGSNVQFQELIEPRELEH